MYIVIGANSSIGYECVKHLARLGSSRVIWEFGAETKARPQRKLSRQTTPILFKYGKSISEDMSLVAALAKKDGEELHRIDGIVENAGTAEGSWVEKEENETNTMVNVFSTFLMALLMLPHLHNSARRFGIVPQLVIVGSGLAFQAKPIWEKMSIGSIFGDLRDRQEWEPKPSNTGYPLSKLLLTFAHFEFADERHFLVLACARLQIGIVLSLIGRSAEMGSGTLLHGLTVGEEAHERYLSVHSVPGWITDGDGREWQARVWEDIDAALEKTCPG
ncbi:hypothetical protein MKX08_001281 [Trichoderma sp. CBMAI-0020]|nr:hypothetical protein MKX08_001281 [Trichoderma sp. CBMAI-0020]